MTEKSGMWHQAGRLVGILVRVVQVVSRILGLAAALIILLMLLANAVDIVLRTTGNEPLRGIFEYTEVALVAIVFLGLPYTMQIGGHVAIDSVTTRMPAVVRRYVEAIALIAVLPFVLWLTVASVDVAIDSYREREVKFGVVEAPVWPARMLIPVGSGLLAAEMAIAIGQTLSGKPAERADRGASDHV